MIDETKDALFGGALAIRQPARRAGYRVNVDAILLAAFAAPPQRRARLAVDLGAGVGAIGLSLLHLDAAEAVAMIEIDPALARMATENASGNGWSSRVEVLCGDVGTVDVLDGQADLVVCNPPYVAPGRGRPPKAALTRARVGELDAFVDAARRIAGRRARCCFVYPALETAGLFAALRTRGLEPKRLRFVHGRPADPARIVLVECVAGKPGGLSVEAPLVETDGNGRASAAIRTLLTTPRQAS